MAYEARPELTVGERLILIETMVGRLEQKLFGNGNPGEIAALEGRISGLEKSDIEHRATTAGQRTLWAALGTIAGLLIGVAALLIGRK